MSSQNNNSTPPPDVATGSSSHETEAGASAVATTDDIISVVEEVNETEDTENAEARRPNSGNSVPIGDANGTYLLSDGVDDAAAPEAPVESASDSQLLRMIVNLQSELASVKEAMGHMKDELDARVTQVETNLEATENVLITEFAAQQKQFQEEVEQELFRIEQLVDPAAALEKTGKNGVQKGSPMYDEEIVVRPALKTTKSGYVQGSCFSLGIDGISKEFGEEENHIYDATTDDNRFQSRLSTRRLRFTKELKKHLTSDTFSFMIAAPTTTPPFLLSIAVICMQMTSFFLVAANMLDISDQENPFNIPTNVNAWVRVSQVMAIIIAVVTQNDLITSFDLMRGGYNRGLEGTFEDATFWKYALSTTLRFLEGSASLFLIFILAVSSETVIDLLLNFTALEFVSQFDEAFFFLSRHGFMGLTCEEMAYTILRKSYTVPRKRFDRSFKMTCMLGFLAALLSGWGAVIHQQVQGRFLCHTVMVQFGDALPELGTFSGLYDKSTKNLPPFSSKHVEYVGRHVGKQGQKAKIAYCGRIDAWTFNWDKSDNSDDIDPCDWKARSSSTSAFDLTETVSAPWYFQNEFQREILLEPFYLSCYDCEDQDEQCSGRGKCDNAVCDCDDGWSGLRCEFPEPCGIMHVSADRRLSSFPGIKKWSNDFEILMDEKGIINTYSRPVYIGQATQDDFNIIVFTGRRWAATYLDFFEDLDIDRSVGPDGTKHQLAQYFRDDFHGHWSKFTTEFFSEPTDIGTVGDSQAPVVLSWFYANPVGPGNSTGIQAVNSALTVQTLLLCSVCNNETNPCLYDGICGEDGKCKCSAGTEGERCEQPPIGNGHCDPFFNIPEFDYDGGDCCDMTCTSSVFVCGMDESGFVSVGYPLCLLPPQWVLNNGGDAIIGETSSSSGFAVALSATGNFMVIAGHRNDDKAYVYDKDGSHWNFRASISLLGNATEDISTFDLIKIQIREVNRGQVNNPKVLAPLEVSFLTDSYNAVQIFRCEGDVECRKIHDIGSSSFAGQKQRWFDMTSDGSFMLLESWGLTDGIMVYFNDRARRNFYDFDAQIVFPEQDLNYETPTPLTFLLDAAMSDDKNTLAAVIRSNLTVSLLTYSRVGFEYNRTAKIQVANVTPTNQDESFSPIGLGSLELSSNGMVLALALCDTPERLHVFRWDGDEWERQPSPNITGIPCNWSFREAEKSAPRSYLQLSGDGSLLAFAENLYYDDTVVVSYEWRESQWERIELPFLSRNSIMSISLSHDGNILAVGVPFSRFDDAGETFVYSRPLSNKCTENHTSWYLSLTTDENDYETPWLLATSEGDVIEYGFSDNSGSTIVTESCLAGADTTCYSLLLFNDYDVNPPIYGLFEDEAQIQRTNGPNRRSILRQRFGQCQNQSPSSSSCSQDTSLIEVVTTLTADQTGQRWSIVDAYTGGVAMEGGPYADGLDIITEDQACLDIESSCYIFYSYEPPSKRLFGTRVYVDGTLTREPGSFNGPVFFGKENNGCCPDSGVRTVIQLVTCGTVDWNLAVLGETEIVSGTEFPTIVSEENCLWNEELRKVVWQDYCLNMQKCHEFTLVGGAEYTKTHIFFPSNDIQSVTRGMLNRTIIFGNCSDGQFYGEPSAEPIQLSHSVPLGYQSGYGGSEQMYVVHDIPVGENITCALNGENGDADIEIFFDSATDLWCSSAGGTSVEECETGPAPPDASLIVIVRAYQSYTNVVIECFVKGQPVRLQDGVPLRGQTSSSSNQLYTLGPIEPGDYGICSIEGNNGDADLRIYFANDPDTSCGSAAGGSNEQCSVGPASNSTVLYAEIIPFTPYSDLTIACSVGNASNIPTASHLEGIQPVNLSAGIPLHGQSGEEGDVQLYILDQIGFGEHGVCILRGDNGEVDLFIYFVGEEGEGCGSYQSGTNEQCVVGPASSDTALYAEVHTYQSYSNLTITCSTGNSSYTGSIIDSASKDYFEGLKPTNLTADLPLHGQSVKSGEQKVYSLRPIPAGSNATCILENSSRNVFFYTIFAYNPNDMAYSDIDWVSRVQESTLGPALTDTVLYAVLHADQQYSNVTITCSVVI